MASRRRKAQTVTDALIRRGALTELFARGLQRRLRDQISGEIFPSVIGKVVARMENLPENVDWSSARWKKFIRSITDEVDSGFEKLSSDLRNELREFAADERRWSKSNLGSGLTAPSAARVRSMVDQPHQGATIEEWIDGISTRTSVAIISTVRRGIDSGLEVDEVLNQIRGTRRRSGGILNTAISQVDAIANTSIFSVVNQIRVAFLKSNTKFNRFIWIATLDSKICPACLPRHGEVVEVGDGPMPPLHHRCRCILQPLPKNQKEPILNSFEDWIRRRPRSEQDQILGKTKAKMWRDGEVDIASMSDASGRILTLSELSRL